MRAKGPAALRDIASDAGDRLLARLPLALTRRLPGGPARIERARAGAPAVAWTYPGRMVALIGGTAGLGRWCERHADWVDASPAQRRERLRGLVDSGRGHEAVWLSTLLTAASPSAPACKAHHEVLVWGGHIDTSLGFARWCSRSVGYFLGAVLEVKSRLANKQPEQALALIDGLPPLRHRAFIRFWVRAHMECGQYHEAAAILAQHGRRLSECERRLLLHDCQLASGDLDGALAQAALPAIAERPHEALAQQLFQRRVSSRRLRDGPASAATTARELAALEREMPPDRRPDLAALYFHNCQFGDVRRLLMPAHQASDLRPAARLLLANTFYCERDFAQAAATLAPLVGSARHFDANKLLSRITFECGQTTRALALRTRNQRFSHGLDEVLYYARLARGEHADAFLQYAEKGEFRRLRHHFGAAAEPGPEFGQVPRRLVVAEAGPGDEIQASALYAAIAERSETLYCTCDPRLAPLLARSFPRIRFLPVARAWRRRGAPGSPAAAGDRRSLHDLLDRASEQVAAACDRVTTTKCLQHLLHSDGPCTAPAARLMPCPAARARWQAEFADLAAPLVGLVWRSEVSEPIRNIHYLDAREAAALVPAHSHLLCLQYQADAAERAVLAERFGDRVLYLADALLHDELDTLAALLSVVDVVIGVGSTNAELASAVGTPTVVLHPTAFGGWAMQRQRSGRWVHPRTRIVSGEDSRGRQDMLRDAACAVRRLLETSPARATVHPGQLTQA